MAVNVAAMPLTERLKEVLTRSKKNFGRGPRGDRLLLSPTEIVEVLLLDVGAFTIGRSNDRSAGGTGRLTRSPTNSLCEFRRFNVPEPLAVVTAIAQPST
jgi:hypothetical protein